MGYGAWLHGEAVGCGMVMAAELSRAWGWSMRPLPTRCARWCSAPACRARPGPLRRDNATAISLMRVDKKAEAGEIRFVVIDGPGRAGVRAGARCAGARGDRRMLRAAPQRGGKRRP
jgi:3-dehydroquinate synthase